MPDVKVPDDTVPADKSTLQPIQPVVVTVVGTGDGGGTPIPSGTELRTPDHQPNVIVQVVSPAVALMVRFANSYVTTLVGLVTAGVTTNAIPAPDFYHLVMKCAGLSLAGPALGLGKDVITILGNLEKKYPIATGSV